MVAWTIENELKLCVAVIEEYDAKSPDFAHIAKVMNNITGGNFSKEGIRQHFQKKILKNVLVVKADGSAPDASTPKSARGPKAKKSSVNGPSKEPKAKAITAPPRNNRKRKVDTQTADEEEQSSNPAKSVKVEQEAQEEERLDAEVDLEDGEKSPLEA